MKHFIALIALFSLASASVVTTDEACCPETPQSSYLALKAPVFAETVEKATVKGTIVFDGDKIPETKPLEIAEAQSKDCTTGEPVDPTNYSLVVDEKTKGILNCVVSVVVKDAEVKIPEEPIELDQAQCRYEPHVILIPAGATVDYLNSDTISHNVHTYAVKNQAFNKIIPAGKKGSQKLEKPEGTPQPLRLAIRLDHIHRTASKCQIIECFLVYRKIATGRTIFRRHVGNGSTICQGQ